MVPVMVRRIASIVLVGLLTTHCYSGKSSEDEGSSGAADGTAGTGNTDDGSVTGTVSTTNESTVSPTTDPTADDDAGDWTTITTSGPDGDTTEAVTSGPDPSTGGEETGTTTDEPPPPPPSIHYVGRYDDSDPNHVRMGWSGVGAVVRFNGTGASVRLDDKGRYFTVLVDGQLQPTLATSPGEQSYPLAQGLPAGEHTVEFYRRTEGGPGETVVLGVDLEGELLAPPPVERRIEVIGDSITCGYGNEGIAPCDFSDETENHYLTYGAIAARTLGAEISTVAWSGKGMVNNYGDNVDKPMPEIYDRTVASDAAPWSFAWQPDVVVINLGTNDFSTDGDPAENVFVPAYVQFMAHLRDVYPDAFILAISPSLWGEEAAMVDGYLQSAVDQRHMAGDPEVGFANVNVEWIGSGCNGHPSVATHEAMGAKLAQTLQAQLGW